MSGATTKEGRGGEEETTTTPLFDITIALRHADYQTTGA